MVVVIFESHSTSLDNEARIASGWYDVDLSPIGEQQARELGERHSNDSLAAVFCSDLRRSYRTAEIAFQGKSLPIVRDPRLRECDYGDWTRRASGEIESAKTARVTERFPNGESYQQVMLRMWNFLQELPGRYNESRVMIIGHRATWYALEHWLAETPLREVIQRPWQWQPGWIYRLNR